MTADGAKWFTEPVSLDQALEADLDDLESFPRVQQALEHIQYFGENLPEGMKISCPVAVGPLTTADMILGADIWMQFYDQPEKLRRLLDKITGATIKLLKMYKAVGGEAMDVAWIGPLYMSCGGVKIGNDRMAML